MYYSIISKIKTSHGNLNIDIIKIVFPTSGMIAQEENENFETCYTKNLT